MDNASSSSWVIPFIYYERATAATTVRIYGYFIFFLFVCARTSNIADHFAPVIPISEWPRNAEGRWLGAQLEVPRAQQNLRNLLTVRYTAYSCRNIKPLFRLQSNRANGQTQTSSPKPLIRQRAFGNPLENMSGSILASQMRVHAQAG